MLYSIYNFDELFLKMLTIPFLLRQDGCPFACLRLIAISEPIGLFFIIIYLHDASISKKCIEYVY